MIAFVLRRVLQSLTVMLAVGLIAFALFRFVGDPINNMVGQDTGERDRAELRKNLGLDDPFVVQFARFLGNAEEGDGGVARTRHHAADAGGQIGGICAVATYKNAQVRHSLCPVSMV